MPGNGLTASLDGAELLGGSFKFISGQIAVSDETAKRAERLSEEGKTPLLFARGGALIGIIAVADVIKDDSPQAIEQMRNMGIHVVMLTGDNERTAKAIGAKAGVDEVIAGVLPDGKESVIRRLKEKGKVIMVGDGVNDAPALTSADIGIAIGAGADVAIDAADVVLMKSRLSDVPAAIRLSRATLLNIHENLFWAFIYNIDRHSACRRRVYKCARLAAQPDVCRGSNEPFKLQRSDKRSAPESLSKCTTQSRDHKLRKKLKTTSRKGDKTNGKDH